MKTHTIAVSKLSFITAAVVALGLTLSLYAVNSHAAPPPRAVCQAEGLRLSGLTDLIFAKIRILNGSVSPILEYSSVVLNQLDFNGATVSFNAFVPPAGYQFNKIILTVDPNNDCGLVGEPKVRFIGPNNAVQDVALTDPSIHHPRGTIFNLLMDLLGFPDVTFPEGTQQEIAVQVCEKIQSELTDGNGLALSTAGDIGTILGSFYANLGVCLWNSNLMEVVDPNQVKTTACSPYDLGGRVPLTLLQGAPFVDLNVVSSGTGTYTVTNNENGTLATISFNADGTCAAESNLDIQI